MLSDYLHHLGIFGCGAVHVAVQVLVAVTLQLLNDTARDELHLSLGGREVEELATVKQRRTANADMHLFGATLVHLLHVVAQLRAPHNGIVAKNDTLTFQQVAVGQQLHFGYMLAHILVGRHKTP